MTTPCLQQTAFFLVVLSSRSCLFPGPTCPTIFLVPPPTCPIFLHSYLPYYPTCPIVFLVIPSSCPIFFGPTSPFPGPAFNLLSYFLSLTFHESNHLLSYLLHGPAFFLLSHLPRSLLPLHLLIPSAWNIISPFFTQQTPAYHHSFSGTSQRPVFSLTSIVPLLPCTIVYIFFFLVLQVPCYLKVEHSYETICKPKWRKAVFPAS